MKLLLLILITYTCGGFTGFAMVKSENRALSFLSALTHALAIVSWVCILIYFLICGIIS